MAADWFDHLTSFFARWFNIMIETNWVNFVHWWVLWLSQACFFLRIFSLFVFSFDLKFDIYHSIWDRSWDVITLKKDYEVAAAS